MFGTMIRQIQYGAQMLRGGRLTVSGLEGTVADLRATIEEFGEPGEEAAVMLPGGTEPDPQIQRTMADRRLKLTVRQAAAHVPYYRRLFAELGLSPHDLSLDTLALLPPTPKSALRAASSAFVSERSEPVLLAQTTGTTGTPTSVWFSRYELELAAALSAMSFLMGSALRSRHIVLSTISSRATLAKLTVQRALAMVGAGFLAMGTVDPRIIIDRLATPMRLPGKEPQVTHLIVTASALGGLVQTAERDGWHPADFGLRQILVGGEVLSDPLRSRAEEAFGARVTDTYSMTETLPTAGLACEEGHLHLSAEQAHIEVLDPLTHAPAGPGETGTLVVTPYTQYRDTTLLLRYDTGDLVRRLPGAEPPTCSLHGMPATSRILGRHSNGPAELTPRAVLDRLQAERRLPLPTRYAVSPGPDGPRLYVVADRPSAALLARVEERVDDLPLSGVILLEDPDELPEPCRVRADLTEHSFELPSPRHQPARSAP
ncbi:phenylacetate--CoA ligase family protein [Streptomyces sp. TLI_146]|uniref:phenylacetate--CoA ligase family protein n=1 Tax=Streptomyces sp. TLI_146 TaxID=1938858 RepID=UPI000C70488E|nr:AMP-binding protein [Streptomyces sp. TLI_146]PKV83254.1 phenylacetate-coenzyme A ligase PaaK-like adenylate-forming protein [Streptomyces sp. TLI_146]